MSEMTLACEAEPAIGMASAAVLEEVFFKLLAGRLCLRLALLAAAGRFREDTEAGLAVALREEADASLVLCALVE